MGAKTLDARGMSCPMPIVAIAREARTLKGGEDLIVLSDDNAFPADVTAWCQKTGNKLVSIESDAGGHRAQIQKAGA